MASTEKADYRAATFLSCDGLACFSEAGNVLLTSAAFLKASLRQWLEALLSGIGWLPQGCEESFLPHLDSAVHETQPRFAEF